MSALASSGWRSGAHAIVATPPIPQAAEEGAVKKRIHILRDTLVVLAIQIVFRATLVLRRWNY
jgi:hypothetical protein